MIHIESMWRFARASICLAAPVLVLLGCHTDQRPTQASADVSKRTPATLRLLVISDPALAKVIKREWEARSEGEIDLQEMNSDDLLQIRDRRINADAVVYPSALLGDLASREWLAPLPKDKLDDPSYQFRDIFAATRKQELLWEEQTYAVPLGSAPLLLFYRQDILQELSLQPPQTWPEYKTVSARLADRANVQKFLSAGQLEWCGSIEPVSDLWAAQVLLARAAAYSKHRSQFSTLFDYRSMAPLIAGPPFVRALQDKSGPKTYLECSPSEAVQRLRRGECAMAIGWLAPEKELPASSTPASSGSPPAIAVARLPGSKEVYNFRSESWDQRSTDESLHVPLVGIGGRLVSMTQECRQPSEAIRLLMWLSGPEMSAQISAASVASAPFRESHVPQIDKWMTAWRSRELLSQDTVKQYADAIQQSLSETNCLIALRIPGREQYLKALADGVRQTIEGKASAETALTEVARQWQEITTLQGAEKQRLAYARSIGLRP
jgi:multiple sugar transport system substrate-binding protein